MRLYVIRHGETVWNTEGRLQGRTDIELNENGIRLARETAEKMADIPFDLAISSPLKRAVETARIVLGDRDIPILLDERIQEISFGEWEGLCCRGDNYNVPEEFTLFFKDPWNYQPPKGGETLHEVCARTKDFYDELISKEEYQDKTILIAMHGCSTRAFLRSVYEDKNDFWHRNVPPNCAVNILDVQNGKAKFLAEDVVYYDRTKIKNFYDMKEKK